MSNTNQFDWVDFYKELAQKLLQYKSNRESLIEKVKRVYEVTGFKMPMIEKDNQIMDIDPFTVFGFFNKKLTDANRVAILNAVTELFGVSSPVPHSFDSLPVLNPQNAVFYPFIMERKDTDIDELWELFDAALAYAENPVADNRVRVAKHFDVAVNIKGNGNSKITMGLYWIAPDAFLNLDQRNTWYIYESGKIPSEIVETLPTIEAKIPAEKYFDIVEKLRIYLQSDASGLNNFKELSFEAWRYSEEVNKQNAQAKKAQQESKGAGLADEDVRTIHYWLYAPGRGASMWDQFFRDGVIGIGWYEIGDLSRFSTREQITVQLQKDNPGHSYKNDSLALWQFLTQMQPGDIVYAKRGAHQILARGVVTSDYEYDPDYNDQYPNIRRVEWRQTEILERADKIVQKTLTDITSITDYVRELEDWFADPEDEEADDPARPADPPYSPEHFLKDVYMDRASYETLVGLVRKKKNVILQGAPGVGKTYTAKRLAYSMIGVKDQERIMMVQFHQSYSYEDFIEGFRPASASGGFEIKKGSFYLFCRKAEDDLEHEYFFFFFEINRGNLSKIFGELFMLIESDKRGNALQLLYSDEKFSVPQNVYIIGMMNTADRSLAMLDYALRRRFAFYEMKPGFNTEGFRKYRTGLNNIKFDNLINCVEQLNAAIAGDESLGEGFCIGHSYFCNLTEVNDQALSAIVEYEVIPLLKEYWFDEPVKVKNWADSLRSAIK